MLNGFLYFITFLFWSYFFCEGHYFSAMGVTLDKYRTCIGLFNSFRVIRCSDFFRTSFFHYCLKFIMFSISQIFKYFSFSSVNSVAAEFQFFFFTCFTAISSSCNRRILKPILGRVGGGARYLFIIGI